jgi:NAD+ dependent glucose-6-phosphate dehydrogenase
MKVLVTGAAGHVATLALPGLAGHQLRLVDIRPPARLPVNATFERLSVLACSDAELCGLFRGAEVVVHSAYIPSGERDVYSLAPPQLERFDAEFDNIRMAQRVYRCALEAGVRRVVVVSSNHAADWYEHAQVHQRRRETVYETDYPLADNFYGWAKASYELLAHPYACGTFGRRLEFVLLRIGSPYPIDPARYEPGAPPPLSGLPRPQGAAAFKRALGAWLSDRDCAALFGCAVDAPLALPADAVPWVIAYGISDNTRAFWSLQSARAVLGYAPADDSEIAYADDVRRLLGTGWSDASGRLGPAAR